MRSNRVATQKHRHSCKVYTYTPTDAILAHTRTADRSDDNTNAVTRSRRIATYTHTTDGINRDGYKAPKHTSNINTWIIHPSNATQTQNKTHLCKLTDSTI